MRLNITLVLLLTTIGLSQLRAQCNGAQFQEVNGIAVIEAESPSTPSTWRRETASNPYTGNSYLAYRGSSAFNNPGTNVINYSVRINSPGTYRFIWRNKVGIIANTNPSTEHNDSWLKIQASNFYAQRGTSRVYPKGSGKTPVPEGAGGGGWFKIYSSGTTNWTWSTNTFDNRSHAIYAVFNNAGVYTIQVSARSQGHFIDRMVLYKESSYTTSEAQSLSRAQTNCGGGSPPPPPPPPTDEPVVNSFSYINAGTDNVIGTLNNGAQINISSGPSNLAFRANANGDTGSVRLQLTGPVSSTRNDNNVPYSSFGDSGNNYTGRTMQVGNYTLTATPYVQDNLGGDQGAVQTINFSVVSNTSPPPPPPPGGNNAISFTWINAGTDSNLQLISNGTTVNGTGSNRNIRVNTTYSLAKSVFLRLQGRQSRTWTENVQPYALYGDNNGNYNSANFPNGSYTLTVQVYAGVNRTGSLLGSETINFNVGSATSKEAIGAAYVYPNPVKDGKFSVKLPETMKGEVTYSLINASGNTVENGKVSVSAAGDTAEFNMDASSYKHGGMYYIVLQSGAIRYTLPLIKK